MNKKGFTLAELLGVIVIISLLVILVMPSIINKLSKNKSEVNTSLNELIYKASDTYISENKDLFTPVNGGKKYCISLRTLIDDGKLSEPVKDITSDEDISDTKSVLVTVYSNGVFDHSLVKSDNCQDSDYSSLIEFVVTPSGTDWVKSRSVTINYPNLGDGYKYYSKKGNGDWVENNGGTVTIHDIKNNSKYVVSAKAVGENVISSSVNVYNVDSIKPYIVDVFVNNNFTNVDSSVVFQANDPLSGVSAYYVGTDSTTPSLNASGWIDWPGGTSITIFEPNGSYYLWVRDKAGNISDPKTFSVSSVDKIKPSCELTVSGIKGDNDYYTGDVTISFKNRDDIDSGLKNYEISDSKTSNYNSNVNNKIYTGSDGKVTYYGHVIDNAGNTNMCSISFNRDSTKPTCKLKVSGTMGDNDWYTSDVNVSFDYLKDNFSGVNSYDINTSSNELFDNLDSKVLKSDSSSITYFGHVKDNAGNINSCNVTFKRDSSKPTFSISTSKDTSSITTIVNNAYALSGIKSYEYSKDGGKSWYNGGNTYTFNHLKANESYDIKVRVTSNAGLDDTKGITVSTNVLPIPTFKTRDTGKASDIKYVTIIFGSGCNSEYVCTYTDNAGKTVTVKDSSVEALYTENGFITAKITDNVRVSSSSYTLNLYFTLSSLKYSGGLTYDEYANNGRKIFQGANPDNYIIFNGSKWRVVSIEDDSSVQIVSDTSLGKMAYDNNSNRGTYCSYSSLGCNSFYAVSNEENQWFKGNVTSDSSLKSYLDSNLYNKLSSKYKSLVMTGKNRIRFGAAGDTLGVSPISNTYSAYPRDDDYTFGYLWSHVNRSISSKDVYVHLLNVYDYVMASSNGNCSNLKNNSECANDNWMNKGSDMWLSTKVFDSPTALWFVNSSGNLVSSSGKINLPSGVYGTDSDSSANALHNVYPSVYLSPNTKIYANTSGIASLPYEIFD